MDFESGDWFDRIDRFDRFEDQWQNMDREFERLRIEPSSRTPSVGNRVVFAAGLVGLGHPWIREEAEVIEVGETSVRIRLVRLIGGSEYVIWISPVLITDVIQKGES